MANLTMKSLDKIAKAFRKAGCKDDIPKCILVADWIKNNAFKRWIKLNEKI